MLLMRNSSVLAFIITVILSISIFSQTIYKEAGGVLVMEMENSKSPLGKWVKKSNGSGWSGSGMLEFTGNDHNGAGSDRDPQKFHFKITKAGTYGIHPHAFNRLDGQPADKCNDAFVKVTGDYTSGASNVPLSALQKDTKLYSSNGGNVWSWGFQLDGNGADHVAAKYNLKSGEEYALTISGRSIRFQIDRILFAHNDANLNQAKNAKESDTVVTTAISHNTLYNKNIKDGSPISCAKGIVHFTDMQSGTYSVFLTTLSGKTVSQMPLHIAEKSSTTAVSLNIDHIVNGVYITRVVGKGVCEKKVIYLHK